MGTRTAARISLSMTGKVISDPVLEHSCPLALVKACNLVPNPLPQVHKFIRMHALRPEALYQHLAQGWDCGSSKAIDWLVLKEMTTASFTACCYLGTAYQIRIIAQKPRGDWHDHGRTVCICEQFF